MPFCILIVDDSATTRGLIKRVINLAQLGDCEIREAPDGKAALDLLHEFHVDLVLADLHMPEMTGVELAHAMFGHPNLRAIPVVIVSAEPSAERIAALRNAGVKGYLRKPCSPESLRDLIAPFVEVHHGKCAP